MHLIRRIVDARPQPKGDTIGGRQSGQDARVLGKVEIDGLIKEFYGAGMERQQKILAELTTIVDPTTRDRALSDLCRGVPYNALNVQIPLIVHAMGSIVEALESTSLVAMVASRDTNRPTQEKAMRILINNDCLDNLISVAFIARDEGIALWAVHELGERRDSKRLKRILGAPFMQDKQVEEAVLRKVRELIATIENE
ncbi:MAG: hypothetical protein ABID61_04910 [Candidatus Micrarchaeota archaeon]